VESAGLPVGCGSERSTAVSAPGQMVDIGVTACIYIAQDKEANRWYWRAAGGTGARVGLGTTETRKDHAGLFV